MSFDNHNYSRYEEDLSSFGRNVLQILMQRWNQDREHYENVITNQQRHQQQHYQRPTYRKNRVLKFDDANITPTLLSPPTCPNDMNDDSPFDFDVAPDPPPLTVQVVPTSVELLNSFDEGVEGTRFGSRQLQYNLDLTNEQTVARPQVLLDRGICPQNPENPKPHMNQKPSVNLKPLLKPNPAVNLQPLVRPKPPMRPQSPVPIPLLQPHGTNTNIYPHTSTFLLNTVAQIHNCEEPIADQSPEQCNPVQKPRKPRQETKKKTKVVENNKAPKRKIQTKVTDTAPKKVKKVESASKNPFRKDRYPKAVKRWLKDIDPALPVDEEVVGEEGVGEVEHRVVQARLTNIGGTMKFAKPANNPCLTNKPQATPAQINKKDEPIEVKNKPRGAVKEINNKPSDEVKEMNNEPRNVMKEMNNEPRDVMKEMNNEPRDAVRDINNEPRDVVNNKPRDKVKKVKAKPINAMKEVNNKPRDTVKEVSNELTNEVKEVINKARDAMKESNNKPRDTKEINSKPKVKKSKPRFVVPLKSQSTQQTNQSMSRTSQETCQPSVVFSQPPACIKSPDAAACAKLTTGSELVVMLIPGGGGENTRGILVLHGDCAYSVESAHGVHGEFLHRILRECTIVCYDGKRLLRHFMDLLNLEVDCMDLSVRDVKVAGSLVWADDPPATLEALLRTSKEMGDYVQTLGSSVQNLGGSVQKSGGSDHSGASQQAGGWEPMKRALQIRAAASSLFEKLEAEGMWTLFVDIEMNVLPIVAAMEHRGLPIDSALVDQLEQALQSASTQCEQAAHACAGRALSLHAPAALRKCLYDELQLDWRANIKVNHTPANRDKSTSEEMLQALSAVHPLPGLIIHYRRLHKARVTYVAAMKTHTKNGVLYPTWLQCAAATGRIGCANPNVQALPAQPVPLACPEFKGGFPTANNPPADDNAVHSPPIGDDAGSDADDETVDDDNLHGDHAADNTESANIRAVIRARKGYTLVACDYRHTECRLLARASGDAALQAALHADDIFVELAAYWLDKPVSAITSRDRALSKRALYAVSYGCGAAKLRHLTAARSDAAARLMLHTFNTKFPGLRSFVRSVSARAGGSGGVLRLGSGRQRRLQASRGATLTPRAQRQAVNFMIQGAAADLCKLAMVRTQRATRDMDARLLLTVHDELVWEVENSIVVPFAGVVRAVMEACGGADVAEGGGQLPVSVHAGPHWGHMTPLHFHGTNE